MRTHSSRPSTLDLGKLFASVSSARNTKLALAVCGQLNASCLEDLAVAMASGIRQDKHNVRIAEKSWLDQARRLLCESIYFGAQMRHFIILNSDSCSKSIRRLLRGMLLQSSIQRARAWLIIEPDSKNFSSENEQTHWHVFAYGHDADSLSQSNKLCRVSQSYSDPGYVKIIRYCKIDLYYTVNQTLQFGNLTCSGQAFEVLGRFWNPFGCFFGPEVISFAGLYCTTLFHIIGFNN